MRKLPVIAGVLGMAAAPLLYSGVASAEDPAGGIGAWFGGPAAPPPAVIVMRPVPVADPIFAAFHELDAMMASSTVAQIMAAQQAAMQRLMQQMAAPFPTLSPAGVPAGASVVVTEVAIGNGGCNQVVTTAYGGNDGQPHVTVRRTGSACDALPDPRTQTVPAAQPDSTPPQRDRPRLLQVRQPEPAPQRPVYHG